jgi:hypothetical protein
MRTNGKLKSRGKRYVSTDWNNRDGYQYKIISTTDFETPAKDLILLYNARGGSERRFDFMKNDLGWRWAPYQWMTQNTVFLIISAMASNLFRAAAKLFDENLDGVDLKARIRKFQKNFINIIAICVEGQWTFHGKKIDLSKIA